MGIGTHGGTSAATAWSRVPLTSLMPISLRATPIPVRYEAHTVNEHPHHQLRPYEILILALSLYAIFALALEVVVPLDASSRQILGWADTAVCVLFLFD